MSVSPGIHVLFERMVAREASDLHLTSGLRPYVRIHGDIQPFDDRPVLTAEAVRELIEAIMPERNRAEFAETSDTDFGYEVPGLARFRANVFLDRHGMGAVFRVIPSRILTADDLNLPPAVRAFCELRKGLVIVTGPTGSGKSTTLAAMIDLINRSRTEHIVTIEDPIEFVHAPHRCLVHQREVHAHTRSFARALRAVLREDPDVVMVGELRDLETVQIAIETAETGHLVFGTLHTNTAASAVDRIIDMFPADRQNQIRTMLAGSLKGVVAQTLCKRIPKGRIAALEVLVSTSGVASNIRDAKSYQIPSAMQTGRNVGMQLLNDELFRLVAEGLVRPEEAHARAVDKVELAKRLEAAGFALESPTPPPAAAPVEPPRRTVRGSPFATGGVGAAASPADVDATSAGMLVRLRRDLERNPNSSDVLNNVAWILATDADPDIRNPAQAVKLAERAFQLTQGRNPAVLDTLAAAHSAAGQAAEAVSSARRALDLALQLGDTELARGVRERLTGYEAEAPVQALRRR